MRTNDALLCMNDLRDTQQVSWLMRMNDAFVRTSDALARMSDAFVRTSASFVLTKDVMTVAAQGTAISSLEKQKPRRWARLFLFLLSIFRIPSLAIKPAKYL